jgi:hypothetical protein
VLDELLTLLLSNGLLQPSRIVKLIEAYESLLRVYRLKTQQRPSALRLPDDEMGIVWNDSFTNEEKVAKLKVLRASKEVKPRSFSKRLTKAGRLHAQGMGIRLH